MSVVLLTELYILFVPVTLLEIFLAELQETN